MDSLVFTGKDVAQIIGMLVAGVVMLAGVARWLMARQDKQLEDVKTDNDNEHERLRATLARAHERLDGLPQTYVQRQEVMDHFARIEKGQSEMRGEFNQRLDRLIQMISTGRSNRAEG